MARMNKDAAAARDRSAHRQELDQINRKLKSKRGFVKYLKARKTDPAPILREIARHREEMEKHAAAITRLQEQLVDLDGAAENAEKELTALENRRAALLSGTPQMRELDDQMSALNARLAALLGEEN